MTSRITGLGELRKAAAGGGAGKDDDKKKKQNNLYTGGASTGSGQNVIGPNHGHDHDDDDDEEGGSAEDVVNRVFKQTGVGGEGAEGTVTIRFWRNGFTVDDGDVRPMDAPENRAFLAALDQNQVPRELQDSLRARGVPPGDVDVKVEDHRSEEWKAPPYRAYSGAGSSLGGGAAQPAGAVVGVGAGGAVHVDATQPTTTIAVKLLDGRREKVVLNLGSTVGDLQRLVAALNGHKGAPFVLLAGYPLKPLAVAEATIDAAGLKGAAVTQQKAGA